MRPLIYDIWAEKLGWYEQGWMDRLGCRGYHQTTVANA